MESFCEELACESRFMEIHPRSEASEEHAPGMFEDILMLNLTTKREPPDKKEESFKSQGL